MGTSPSYDSSSHCLQPGWLIVDQALNSLEWILHPCKFCSVQSSRSVVSDSLRPHESQHARPPCPSPTPWVYPNSCPSSWWCHPAVSSSVIPFSSCPQSLPASGSFPMSQLFVCSGQSIGVSASASVLPMNTQDRSPLGWTGWISVSESFLKTFHPSATCHLASPTVTPWCPSWCSQKPLEGETSCLKHNSESHNTCILALSWVMLSFTFLK